MKKFINLNNFFTKHFVKLLADSGVRNVVLSPGSRSTPLVIAFDQNKRIKKHVVIDERSNAFFALGIAKQTNSPVAIVTTSGTAVAELYPAIIEAFYSRVPLIICSADRPERLVNKGTNQTIVQRDIFKNHIRYFWDSNEISASINYFKTSLHECSKALNVANSHNIGPVHLNIRFEKPLESFVKSHQIDCDLATQLHNFKYKAEPAKGKPVSVPANYSSQISKAKRIFFLVGNNVRNTNDIKAIGKLADKMHALVIADGLSGYRYSNGIKNNVIINSTAFIRNRNFIYELDPDLIIQFGSAPTSNILLNFIAESKSIKYLVNEFADITDPSETYSGIIKSTTQNFCFEFIKKSSAKTSDLKWYNTVIELDNTAQSIKSRIINKSSFGNEAKIIKELFDALPKNANLMVSNSIPPRDIDYFADRKKLPINIYHNRGASGIDGIISTAAGIQAAAQKPTYLLIGDTAFAHDISALSLLARNIIPLKIILINNSGGSIFEMLPVYKEKIDFNKYYKVPSELNFKKIVSSFDGIHTKIKSWNHFRVSLLNSQNQFNVLELITNSQKSLETRKSYWENVISKTQEIIDDNKA